MKLLQRLQKSTLAEPWLARSQLLVVAVVWVALNR
jgi:hypothetical protein